MEVEKKTYWPIDKLSNWKDNPRSCTEKDFKKLKNLITRLGEIKPMIITPDGMVIGGNMRLRAFKELGYKKCWVTVREFKNKVEMIEVALADNERAGYYNDDLLAELVYPLKDEIMLEDFTILMTLITY